MNATGWSLTGPTAIVATGSYGGPKVFPNIPLSGCSPNAGLAIRDAADTTCSTTATVRLPLVLGISGLASNT